MDSHEEQCLPILDFSRNKLVPGTSHWIKTRDTVRRAMEEQGWFVAEFDGVSSTLAEEGGRTESAVVSFQVNESGSVWRLPKFPIHISSAIEGMACQLVLRDLDAHDIYIQLLN